MIAEVSALTGPFFRQSETFSALWLRHIVEVPVNGERPPVRKGLEWERAVRVERPAGGSGRWA
ncbi:hypothetical protein AB0G02_39835, partial [Actinosynnema sp. NPDC023658]|uniref:hypothetical protein n=1 Tax=Actinosynnema sp. NPDC023658 TaxID=3155465 RepID=UPI0033EF0C9D